MHKSMRNLAILFSLALIKPAFAHDVLQSMMNDDAQWASPRKDYANQAYSKLEQINSRNVICMVSGN